VRLAELAELPRKDAMAILHEQMPAQIQEIWRAVNEQHTDEAVWIYVIQVGFDGAAKIGRTKSVAKRLKELQHAHVEGLRVLGAWRGMPSEEQELHREFADLRLRGEWFICTHELQRMAQCLDCWDGA
jgi:hypothetical protein